MCPSARALVMSCVSACGTWHPFKSAAATTHRNNNQEEEDLHLLLPNHDGEAAEATEGGQDPQTEQLLKSLSRHMDILTAGSLFLLPSILPFLASAITAYTAQPPPHPLPSSSLRSGSEQECFLNSVWILLLPCVGVMIPLALFKIMSVFEESGFQCPFKLWKQTRYAHAAAATAEAEASILNDVCEYDTPRGGRGGNARTAAAAMAAGWRGVCRFPNRNSNHINNNNSVHASMISSCPTILAIQSVWRSWRGYPHGYGPLSLDASTPTSPSDSASVSSAASSPCQRCCSQAQKWSQFSAPPTLPLTLVSPRTESQLQEIDLGTPPCCSEEKEKKDKGEPVYQEVLAENAPHHQQMLVDVGMEQVTVKVVRSVLPKPRSILLASLLAWTLLMALSSPLGFNNVDVTSGTPRGATFITPALRDDGLSSPMGLPREKPVSMDRVLFDDGTEDLVATEGGDLILPSPSTFMRNIRVGGFIMPASEQPQPTEQTPEEIRRIEQEQEEEAQFMEKMVSMLEMEAVLEAEEDNDDWIMIDRADYLNREQQEQLPIETFRTEVILLSKRAVPATTLEQETEELVEDEEEPDDLVEDAFDPDNLQAMTMDPEDEHIFRDFLLRLESEDEQQEQQEVNTAEPFIQDTMTEEEENAIPCRFRQVGSFFRTPMTLLPPAIQRLLFGAEEEESHPFFGQASVQTPSAGPRRRARGQVFTYISGWSDLMIFAISLSLGGILVGLAQSRVLHQQLWDQHLAAQCVSLSPASSEKKRRDRSFWISLVSSLLLGGSALVLTILMTVTECWDMPSFYFVGIGLAGMILVHAWVPNLSPEVEVEIDAVTLYDEEKSTEDHLIERDLPSPYVQVFVGEDPAYDAEDEEPLDNRRNACSLDESRRWEVNQSCLEPSCFSP